MSDLFAQSFKWFFMVFISVQKLIILEWGILELAEFILLELERLIDKGAPELFVCLFFFSLFIWLFVFLDICLDVFVAISCFNFLCVFKCFIYWCCFVYWVRLFVRVIVFAENVYFEINVTALSVMAIFTSRRDK